jgi:hypothetical protein
MDTVIRRDTPLAARSHLGAARPPAQHPAGPRVGVGRSAAWGVLPHMTPPTLPSPPSGSGSGVGLGMELGRCPDHRGSQRVGRPSSRRVRAGTTTGCSQTKKTPLTPIGALSAERNTPFASRCHTGAKPRDPSRFRPFPALAVHRGQSRDHHHRRTHTPIISYLLRLCLPVSKPNCFTFYSGGLNGGREWTAGMQIAVKPCSPCRTWRMVCYRERSMRRKIGYTSQFHPQWHSSWPRTYK